MKTFFQFLDEALASFLVKAAARQIFRNKALTSKIARSVAKPAAMTTKVGDVSRTIARPRQITGFQTARGSKYTYTSRPKPHPPQTQRTAAVDPYHPTAPGQKQKSDWTLFTTPDASMTMRQRFVSGSKEPFHQGLPKSPTPKIGRAPVEVWNQYAEKGGRQAIHPGSPITDIQTATPGSGIGLYGSQRKELKDRLKKGFEDPRAIPTLKRELGIKPKPELKVTQVPSVASSNPYRNLGVGRRESVKEAKTFSEFITEANRRAQRASKAGRKPKEGERSRSTEKPSAVVTVGLPGSGKSTIAKHMVSKGNTDQHELDKSRQALGKGPAYFGSDIVQHTYSGAKKSAEQGRNTVLSNTSIPRQHRQDAIDKLKDSGYDKVTPVLSPGSTKAAMRRNRKRTGSKPGEGAVPQFVMNRMAQGMQQMSRDERRELRSNYKKLHKKERFTKPAMRRSGAIR
jgi:predicted kinase